ncbi:MAG: hypothetical protein ACTHKG_18855 [Nocardioides sp.]
MTVQSSLARPAPRTPRPPPAAPRPVRSLARRHSVALACAATLVTHALYLTRELGVDEGGFAVVARYSRTGGPYLYGPSWVDRPPGLITVFALAERLGPYGVRVAAALLAVLLVGAVATAARVLAGPTAARWSAWTAFALSSSVLLQAQRLNGELVAASFVSVSVAALVLAVHRPRTRGTRLLLSLLAGAAASAAVLSKQNFVDAFVFTAALLVVGAATARQRTAYPPSRVVPTALGFASGAALPLAAAALWAADHGGPHALLFATLGFRTEAAAVMASWSPAAPLHRLGILVLLGLGSGLFVLGGHLLVRHGRRLLRPSALPWAIAATAAVELAGIAAGGNFWAHYLIALVPMVSLAVGLGARQRIPGSSTTRALAVVAVLTTAIASPVAAVASEGAPSEAYVIGHWVGTSSRPGDTLVVPFTHANVINASGLEPGYPYNWSLPVRTLDPHLALLVHTLEGRRAPAWVVRWDSPDAWGLDPHGAVDRALLGHYQHVATVCGKTVWLHDGLQRPLAPAPDRC